ncbi:hypothetical protein QCA50_016619 [Cerrena zonata]|uniref:Uncharacterized protein n=1 Tax=Cerrena zonata TaxID=2478898 RepID=A0AAW0FQ83_9APHY
MPQPNDSFNDVSVAIGAFNSERLVQGRIGATNGEFIVPDLTSCLSPLLLNQVAADSKRPLQRIRSKTRPLKSSRSAENLKSKHHRHRSGQLAEALHHGNASSTSLPRIAAAAVPHSSLAAPRPRRDRAESVNEIATASAQERKTSLLDETTAFTAEPEGASDSVCAPAIRVLSASAGSLDVSESPISSTPIHTHPHSAPHSPVPRRSAPPPPKRRKPPAIPAHARAGTTMTGLTSSASQPVLSPLGSEARKACSILAGEDFDIVRFRTNAFFENSTTRLMANIDTPTYLIACSIFFPIS